MTARTINRKARRFLLTGQPEPEAPGYSVPATGAFSGGRWAVLIERSGKKTVHFFPDACSRDAWVALPSAPNAPFSISSTGRVAVGKRHPLVKAYRNRCRNQRRFNTRSARQ